MTEQARQSHPKVSQLNRVEEDSRTMAIAANAVNLRCVEIGTTHWGSNEVNAFLTISRALASLHSGAERRMEGASLSPAVMPQEVNRQLEAAAETLRIEAQKDEGAGQPKANIAVAG